MDIDSVENGVSRTISDATPAHFVVKIQSFSSLTENAMEKYESAEFEAGGYKWKLVLYPNGNKSKNVEDYISLYLEMVDATSLGLDWEVYVIVRLYVLNQKSEKFFLFQDAAGKENRLHSFKRKCGFDRFISVKDFHSTCNGYLVEDTSVFGADVFTKKSTGKGESLTFIENASSVKHVWKIENFSKLEAKCHESEVFVAGDQKWKIHVYPKGDSRASGSHLSMFLALTDLKSITPGTKIYTGFTLRIMDQVKEKHKVIKDNNRWFTTSGQDWGSGCTKFISLSDLNLEGNGYVVNDVCVVEADVTVLGIATAL